MAIVYSKWTAERGWTLPVDVLLPPPAVEFTIKGAFLDPNGVFHVIYFGGNDLGGGVYYSRAPAVTAGNAQAWSPPKMVGDHANMIVAALAGDAQGNLFIFYGGNKDGNGLYEVYSRDGGDTWSDSLPVYLTNDEETYPGTIALLVDNIGELHIAWSDWRPPFGGEQLYYAYLNIRDNRMSFPTILVRGNSTGRSLPDFPAMVMRDETLFLIYQNGGVAENAQMAKAMLLSTDHGRSWTKPVWAFPPVVGGNGAAVLLVDSRNALHALLANRAGDCCHGMWYSSWQGDRWSDLQAIIQGPKTQEFDPTIPQAVMSQGNVLLATWVNEGSLNGVWYSYAKVDAQELPLLPLPTPVPKPVPATTFPAETDPISVNHPTRIPTAPMSADDPVSTVSSPNLAIVLGALPVLALIAVAGFWRNRS